MGLSRCCERNCLSECLSLVDRSLNGAVGVGSTAGVGAGCSGERAPRPPGPLRVARGVGVSLIAFVLVLSGSMPVFILSLGIFIVVLVLGVGMFVAVFVLSVGMFVAVFVLGVGTRGATFALGVGTRRGVFVLGVGTSTRKLE